MDSHKKYVFGLVIGFILAAQALVVPLTFSEHSASAIDEDTFAKIQAKLAAFGVVVDFEALFDLAGVTGTFSGEDGISIPHFLMII